MLASALHMPPLLSTAQVIFNAKPLAVLTFIDKSGASTLMNAFCKQLHSYSVMQALRALLLPALQLHSSSGGGGNVHDYNGPLGAGSLGSAGADMPAWLMPPPATALECDWHRHPEMLMRVVDVLTAPPLDENADGPDAVGRHEDARAQASELLISVLETAGAASAFHTALTNAQALPAFINAAVPPLSDLQNSATAAERLLSGDAAMAAALSVLEVAVVQMADEHAAMVVEAAALAKMLDPSFSSSASSSSSGAEQVSPSAGENNGGGRGGGRVTEESARLLAECVPRVAAYLASHATDARTVACQAPAPPPGSSELNSRQPQLGLARLKLVNFLEALVKLQHPAIDASLTASRVPSILLDLFVKYEWNSLLHQSVSSIVVHLAEGSNTNGSSSSSSGSSQGESARAALQSNLFVEANLPGRLMELFERASANEAKRKKNNKEDGKEALPRFSKGLAHGRPGNFGHGVIMCEAVMKGIANGTTESTTSSNNSSSSIADLVSQSAGGAAWHNFMLSKLADVTAQQCRPLGGFAYPSRQEDVMIGFGDSSSSSGNDGNNDDAVLSDEALAEQISKLGGLNFSGENGDNDSDDEEGEAELALALAKAYNLQGAGNGGSGSGGNNGSSALPSWASHDDDSDDEEEAAELAMALAKQYGIKGTALGGERPSPADEVPRVGIGDSSSEEEEDNSGSGGGGFADFDAFGGSSGGDVAMGASRSEADDFANWGDHHASSGSNNSSGSNGDGFADFSDFGAPAVPPPSGAPPSPGSTNNAAQGSARSPNPPVAASPTEEESRRQGGGSISGSVNGSPMEPSASGNDTGAAVATSPAAAAAAPGAVATELNFEAFGATSAPAPVPTSFDAFGSGTPPPDVSFDAFGSGTPAPAPESASFDAFGSGAPAPDASFDAFGSASPAPESSFGAFGATSAPAPESASFDAFGTLASAPETSFDVFGQKSDAAPAATAPVNFPDPFAAPGPDLDDSTKR